MRNRRTDSVTGITQSNQKVSVAYLTGPGAKALSSPTGARLSRGARWRLRRHSHGCPDAACAVKLAPAACDKRIAAMPVTPPRCDPDRAWMRRNYPPSGRPVVPPAAPPIVTWVPDHPTTRGSGKDGPMRRRRRRCPDEKCLCLLDCGCCHQERHNRCLDQ